MNEVMDSGLRELNKKITTMDIYQITGVNVEDQTYTIKQLNYNKVFENVDVIGLGLGHGKGQLKLLDENDLVIVTFMGDSLNPFIVGSIFNNFMGDNSDTKIPISQDEYLVCNKINGSRLYIREDDSIWLLNNEGYGFEVSANGNVTIRGKTVTYTQTPRT